MLYIIFYLLFALLICYLAVQKEYSLGIGIILGLLGFIGLIILLCLPNNKTGKKYFGENNNISFRNIFFGGLAIVALLLLFLGFKTIGGVSLIAFGYLCTHSMRKIKK
jgi:hypothetical protein